MQVPALSSFWLDIVKKCEVAFTRQVSPLVTTERYKARYFGSKLGAVFILGSIVTNFSQVTTPRDGVERKKKWKEKKRKKKMERKNERKNGKKEVFETIEKRTCFRRPYLRFLSRPPRFCRARRIIERRVRIPHVSPRTRVPLFLIDRTSRQQSSAFPRNSRSPRFPTAFEPRARYCYHRHEDLLDRRGNDKWFP